MQTPDGPMKSRTHRRLWALVVLVAGWLAAFAVIRLGLAWSDTLPYEGATTERRYLVIAATATMLAMLASVFAVILWLRTKPKT